MSEPTLFEDLMKFFQTGFLSLIFSRKVHKSGYCTNCVWQKDVHIAKVLIYRHRTSVERIQFWSALDPQMENDDHGYMSPII